MTEGRQERVVTRSLPGHDFGTARVVSVHADSEGRAVLYFGAEAPGRVAVDGEDVTETLTPIAGGARLVTAPAGDWLALSVGDRTQALPVVAEDRALFADARVLLGLRHAESAGTVADWLRYHADLHGAEAALILDCGDPAARTAFAADLTRALDNHPIPGPVVVVWPEAPLGHRALPPAGHPFNAPAAPGKSRMEAPGADPARAPLAETVVFEALHQRFLAQARAVLSLDVSDLALPSEDGTVFDRVLAVPGGVLALNVREAYPWRLRRGGAARFGDHVCVQFDNPSRRRRWAIVPARVPGAVWRMTRISGAASQPDTAGALRCVAVRHPGVAVAALVPKSSLIEDAGLLGLVRTAFGADPLRLPEASPRTTGPGRGDVTVVTCMKNEGPFILEWLAYHRALGIERFLVYSNDCSDGTDRMLDLLQDRGLVQHRDNPYRRTGQRPQHAAFLAAEDEEIVKDADWLVCLDVDEFINIHAGAGRIADLFAAAGDANMISMTWRLFGNADIAAFEDVPVTRQFTRCAPLLANKPHQAWGFKTLFRHQGLFRKLGVHRPKGLIPQLKDHIRWVNGSGRPMPEAVYRNAWRSTQRTVGYDLVTLNHYAVRSAESFLVKRDRGRVNHVDRDQGLIYWFRMNNNTETDRSIHHHLPAMETELARLKRDPAIAEAHAQAVAAHRARIAELRSQRDYAAFYDDLVSDRMRRLSRLHPHFGAGVFWSGPHVVPDEVAQRDPDDEFFFTVPPEGKGH